jgi:hypothetical protein
MARGPALAGLRVAQRQPHFPGMPAGIWTLWGYGLLIDSGGDYVKEIPPIYHGLLDPKVALKALESAFR